MTRESKLLRIAPNELPALLSRLHREQTTDFVLVGPRVDWLSASPKDWPEELQGRVVYQLTGNLSGLPRELLRCDRLQALAL
jgi:hypothetical protein